VILEPLSGCPSGVRDLADRLTASSRRVGDVTTVLVALKGGATWVSSAGEAFGARLAEAPPLLDAVARRLGGAAVPLREIADAMEEAQRVVEGAIRDDSEAQGTYALLEDRAYALISAGADETSPDVVAVRILQRDQVRIRERARARHAAAMERFRAVDARCSASVRALTQDAVTDSALYRLVAGSQTVGRDLAAVGTVATVVPYLRPVAAAGDVLSVAADTTLLVGYGEGAWSELGTTVAIAAAGNVAGALKIAGTAGATKSASGSVFTRTRRLTTQQRLAVGVTVQARAKRDAILSRFRVEADDRATPTRFIGVTPRPVRTTPVWKVSREQVVARVRTTAQAKADQVFLDGWRRASANGPAAQKMYAAGTTLDLGVKVAPKVLPTVVPQQEPHRAQSAR
jgi:hypothetical protein